MSISGRSSLVSVVSAALIGVLAVAFSPSASADAASFPDGATTPGSMDIHRVEVVNGDRLTIRVVVADLRRRAGQGSASAWLDTDPGRSGPEFYIGSGLWDSDWMIARARGREVVGDGPLSCLIDQRLLFDRDTIVWSTGAACLGRYGRVRVAATTQGAGIADHSPGRRSFHPWVARTRSTPRCVSRAEHDQLRLGMTKPRVHRITDTTGAPWDGHAGGYTRRYELCWRSDAHLYLTFYALATPHVLGEKGIFRP